jgi:hypothetical protein
MSVSLAAAESIAASAGGVVATAVIYPIELVKVWIFASLPKNADCIARLSRVA